MLNRKEQQMKLIELFLSENIKHPFLLVSVTSSSLRLGEFPPHDMASL